MQEKTQKNSIAPLIVLILGLFGLVGVGYFSFVLSKKKTNEVTMSTPASKTEQKKTSQNNDEKKNQKFDRFNDNLFLEGHLSVKKIPFFDVPSQVNSGNRVCLLAFSIINETSHQVVLTEAIYNWTDSQSAEATWDTVGNAIIESNEAWTKRTIARSPLLHKIIFDMRETGFLDQNDIVRTINKRDYIVFEPSEVKKIYIVFEKRNQNFQIRSFGSHCLIIPSFFGQSTKTSQLVESKIEGGSLVGYSVK